MGFLSNFVVLPVRAVEGARIAAVELDGPSVDAARIDPLVRAAAKVEAKNVGPEHVEALAAIALNWKKEIPLLRGDGIDLYPLPGALVAHLAGLDDEAQMKLGNRWERRASGGLGVLVPKLSRLARRVAEGESLYLVVVV